MAKKAAQNRDLFSQQEDVHRKDAQPLSTRMRPRSLEEFTGQSHFLGEGKLLRRLIQTQRLQALIFYGPPGTGKTSLAQLIAREVHYHFVMLNAASCGIKDIREAIDQARIKLETTGQKTILFVDELHHFSKTQQDVLLPDVEEGLITLIGATTSNPFFALVSALVSRSQIFEFKPLEPKDIKHLLTNALHDLERGLGRLGVYVTPEALEFWASICDGDARRALNGLEIAVMSVSQLPKSKQTVTLEVAEESLQRKAIRYDKLGDEHYDAASAMIKSVRGSDPDAALYWMARMLEAGEDPRFVARRIVISASEDIGNADPHGLVLAMSAARAVEMLGMPEGRIPLAQAITYLACAPKSNASYLALDEAIADVREGRLLPVPVHLRDRHYAGSERLGHGEGYQYPHDAPDGFLVQDYLGVEKEYYRPVERGAEKKIKERLDYWRAMRKNGLSPPFSADDAAPSTQ